MAPSSGDDTMNRLSWNMAWRSPLFRQIHIATSNKSMLLCHKYQHFNRHFCNALQIRCQHSHQMVYIEKDHHTIVTFSSEVFTKNTSFCKQQENNLTPTYFSQWARQSSLAMTQICVCFQWPCIIYLLFLYTYILFLLYADYVIPRQLLKQFTNDSKTHRSYVLEVATKWWHMLNSVIIVNKNKKL